MNVVLKNSGRIFYLGYFFKFKIFGNKRKVLSQRMSIWKMKIIIHTMIHTICRGVTRTVAPKVKEINLS